MRILVIDDDENILAILEALLSSSGCHRIQTALSGSEALKIMSETDETFDCFLIDIQMPTVDGISLTKLIRETPGYALQPIIIITAMSGKEYVDEAFNAGATNYITKPFNLEDVQRKLQSAQQSASEKQSFLNQSYVEGELKKLGVEPKKVRLDRPLSIQSIDSSIDYREFENYVVQVSGRKSSKPAVCAVQIQEIENLYDAMNATDFASLISCVGQAIEEKLVKRGGGISYRGNGTFICINEKPLRSTITSLDKAVNKCFSRITAKCNGPVVSIVVGAQETIRTRSSFDALASLSAAVELVERKAESFSELGQAKNSPASHPCAKEKSQLERGAYKMLLQETLSDPENDPWSKKLEQRQLRAR
ncbi:response regulator [Aliiroseovarius subalbicans]|uniref:response regulator n=1 Tax=Aliiroseovarius subalbicans TaxID=2925840 RepID=UPI001F56F2F1|nr:response regulator [Aliiroseovarius subalbicans]MCI2399246.1 response regulator [Aliiroseovarius subalbicans]